MLERFWNWITRKKEVASSKNKELRLWATMYYIPVMENTKNKNDVPLLDMQANHLGPTLERSNWCKAAIEGTVSIDGVIYNYAGETGVSQTTCSLKSSERVRWMISKFPFGMGNRNNPLTPFRSIATDPKFIPSGSKVFIPSAVGSLCPNGDGSYFVHDGYFSADDVGGAIKGNHIDIFIGPVKGGISGALDTNPFSFIESISSKTFEAKIIKE